MSNNNEPPPPNPILSAYEGFVRDTPLVTRYTMTTLVMSWIVSFVADPTFALANIPHYTVLKFEIYRIALSPLVCTNLLTLIFAYISFLDNGKRLEFSLGSTKFAWLMLVLAVSANVAFLVLCFTLYLVTGGENGFLHLQASGIWTMLFALISIECCKAPATSQRRLFFLTVPTVYYPLVLFALFSLFGGFRLSYLLSIGIGYAYGKGYLDRFFQVSDSTFKRWEDTTLANFTRREGWVVGTAATGSAAWSNTNGGGSTGISMFAPQHRQQQGPGSARAPVDPAAASASASGPSMGGAASSGFPKGGGRTLGSASRRPTTTPADARAARLDALERRAGEQQQQDNDDNV